MSLIALLSSFRLKRFRVLLHGTNFKFHNQDGDIEALSFYTTRFVNAEDEDQASEKARAIVLDELKDCLNTRGNPPLLKTEEISLVKWCAHRLRGGGSGYTLY